MKRQQAKGIRLKGKKLDLFVLEVKEWTFRIE